ncbi:hypothetical protein J4573_34295 [Actinomadura barringtoniae]|uniref:Uncharacterized protein n=1 Tax=Actinomadura barringtoniae TaxID=1427535 RepID=A0A939PH90_9ACTN|nr:hypothetical protein [Actinomadura barringtoniae]MBO2452203.1 hypothetical protein [Actinomadura barringtoniae]
MVKVSERVGRRVQADFPHQVDQVLGALAELTDDLLPAEGHGSAAVERIQAAALILARRDLRKLDDALTLGRTDWRDLLAAAGLADDDWPELIDAELMEAPATHIWMAPRP